MNEYRIGLKFEDDIRGGRTSFHDSYRIQLSEIEDTLKSGIACAKEITNYLREVNRTTHLKKKMQATVYAKRKVSDSIVEAAREEYDYYVAGLQERLEAEEKKISLEIQRIKLEIEEKMQRESLTFKESMKKSERLMEMVEEERKQIESLDSQINEAIKLYNTDFDPEIRRQCKLFTHLKAKCIETLDKIFKDLA